MALSPGKDEEQVDIWQEFVTDLKNMGISAFLPGEKEYELSMASANLIYRFTRPHFVVQPKDWQEVLAIVECTYALKLHGQLTIKCGGHSFAGLSTVDQGILVDLQRMTKVQLEFTKDEEPKPSVAVIQAGARWGDVYRALIRKDCRGYVVSGGR